MEYFQDIKFIYWGHIKKYCSYADYYPSHPALQLVRSGTIMFGFGDNAPRKITGPVAYWEHPGKKCVYGNRDGKNWDHSFIVFAGARAEKLLLDGLMQINSSGYVKLHNPLEFISKYDKILRLLDSDHQAAKHARAVVYLEQLVVMLSEAESFQAPLPYHTDIEKLCSEIRRNPLKDWDFHFLAAKRFYISYVYFRQLFKSVSNFAPYDYLLWCRMRHAMLLMREGTKTITEISFECGYEDAAAFSRAFKRKTGLSPSGYNKALRISKL